MAKTDQRIMNFDVSQDLLMQTVIDKEYMLDREKVSGALETELKEIKVTDDEAVFECHNVTYSRGVTGLDKSKTEKSVTTYNWDLKNKKGFYTYVGPHGDRVRVRGDLTISAEGDDKSRLTIDFKIEVKVPLLGGKVEGMVMKEVAKGWGNYEDTLRKHCQRLKG
jgi:hypothetical protein